MTDRRRAEFLETLTLLRTVGYLRRDLAVERNVVEYNNRDDNGSITIDAKGGHLTFARRPRYIAEQYNEQISLLCNSEGAKILDHLDQEEEEKHQDIVHPIYRSQSGPRKEQIQILESIIANTLEAHGMDTAKWAWDEPTESLAGYLKRLQEQKESKPHGSREGRQWNAVLQVIHRQAMITNVAASFTPTPEAGHFSLKMTHYARFSSPMRELVGCFTHKELWEGHLGKFSSPHATAESDILLRDRVIRAARRAKATQKKLGGALHMHMLNLTFYSDLQKRLPKRPVYRGVVMGMDFSESRGKGRRVYVKLEDPSIEIKVFGEDLDYHYGCRYGPVGGTFGRYGSTVSIAPKPKSFAEDADDDKPPTFLAGQSVTIRVGDYAQFYGQTSRSRWIFLMNVAEGDELVDGRQAKRPRTFLRNSLIDRDLLSEEGESSSFLDGE